VCVCVRACVRACVRLHACMHVSVDSDSKIERVHTRADGVREVVFVHACD